MSTNPEHAQTAAETLFFDGNRHLEAGDADAAEQCFRLALSLDPKFAEALSNLGFLREQAGAFTEAEACYRHAVALQADSVQTYRNLGVLLMKCKRLDEAEIITRQAVQLAPDSAVGWSNLGVLLACMKRDDEAQYCYRVALDLDSNYAKARFNLSYILLRQGHWEEDWRCLEARTQYVNLSTYFTFPRWNGEALRGKSILLGIEAGHGDMIQFCRYAPLLKDMGAERVTVVCQPDLKTLFSTLPAVDEVFSCTEEIPTSGWDFWTPPMSLPHFCGTRLDNIPAAIPYLTADPALVLKWSRLMPAAGLRVGLAWKGNPLFENDADRSLPSLDVLAPLGAVTGVHFISLQKGVGEEEALNPPPGFAIQALGTALQDFNDTAALISNLDLVISVDTAVAHLAGSLGKPCWVLLPDYRTDWRWLTERTDSPWYPDHMRLFRQAAGGDWTSVVSELIEALEVCKRAHFSRSAL